MASPTPDYGVDAPTVPIALGIGGLLALAVGIATLPGGVGLVVVAFLLLAQGSLFLHTTRRGKFVVWDEVLDGLALRGDEQLLDLGCGRGAVLMAAAQRLPQGTATGIDLWRSVDQSGNSIEATEANARAEGVAERVTLETGDMAALPFPDARFDVVVSSLAIHNIPSLEGRLAAIDQAVRVLRPGGHLVVADIKSAKHYAARLTETGQADVRSRGLGWRFWYGGPWMATTLVTATKPA